MKIAIDLLPQEFRIEERKRVKFLKVQAIGVVVIMVVTFLALATVVLRFLQSQNIVKLQDKLIFAEKRVEELKNTQASLLLLKDRLTTISKYLEIPSKEVQTYKLISQLVPASVSIGSISIDRGGELLVLATAADGISIDELMSNLISKETNQDKIRQVSIENLSRGRDGVYRLNFKVKLR